MGLFLARKLHRPAPAHAIYDQINTEITQLLHHHRRMHSVADRECQPIYVNPAHAETCARIPSDKLAGNASFDDQFANKNELRRRPEEFSLWRARASDSRQAITKYFPSAGDFCVIY